MLRHTAKGLYQKPVWDIGGTLNELDSPSQVPERDVISCENWKPGQDGKTREKRKGYGKYDTNFLPGTSGKVRGIAEFTDANGFKHILALGDRSIMMKIEIPDYERKYLTPTQGNYGGMKGLGTYGGGILFGSLLESDNKMYIRRSLDGGSTWNIICNWQEYGSCEQSCSSICEYNGKVYFSRYTYGSNYIRIYQWDGATLTAQYVGSPTENFYAYGLTTWGGKLWLVSDVTPFYPNSYRRIIAYYNGASYVEITNYGGTAYLNYGSTTCPNSQVIHRSTILKTWQNSLYLIAAKYVGSTWAWQVWKFNAVFYDRFTKVCDAPAASAGYIPMAAVEYENRIYVITNDWAGSGFPGNNIKVFSSDDMVNWTLEASQTSACCVMGSAIFEDRIYISGDDGTANHYAKIYYYDKDYHAFVQEDQITDNALQYYHGDLLPFGGTLWSAKHREVYKRFITSVSWQEKYSQSGAVHHPIASATIDNKCVMAGYDQNLVADGPNIYGLGIAPPATALTATEGAAGDVTGSYQHLVTFMRSGNYPVESNPSPASAEITVSGKRIELSNIPISDDPKVNARRLYRNYNDGAIFYWLDDILDNTTTTYSDNYTDQDLEGSDEVSYDRGVPANGKYLEVWDNKLWIAGNDEYKNFVFFTNSGTSEEMASNNFIAIKSREDDVITMIKAFGDSLFVFKNRSLHRIDLSGESLYTVTQVPQNIGTDAGFSVAVCDKLLIWKSAEHAIEIFNGTSCFRPPVSDLIKRTMKTINAASIERTSGAHNQSENEYWLAIPTGAPADPEAGDPETVVNLNYLEKTFALYKFYHGITYMSSIKDFDNKMKFLLGTNNAQIYKYGSEYTDDGQLISAAFMTAWLKVSGVDEMWNVLRRMFIKYILPANKTITLKIYVNFNKTAIGTFSLAGNTPTTIPDLRNEILKRLNLGARGYYVAFEFSNAENVGGECKIIGYDLWFKKRIWKSTAKGD